MFNKTRILVFGFALLASGLFAGNAATKASPKRLLSKDPRMRKQAEIEIIKGYNDIVLALEALIDENLTPERLTSDRAGPRVAGAAREEKIVDRRLMGVVSAINILGELRSVHSVPLLVRNMGFTVGALKRQRTVGRLLGLQDYPAANALVKIGLPSLPGVLDAYKVRGKQVRFLTWCIINKVLGKDLAKPYLKKALAAEKDPVKNNRLKELLEHL